MNNKLSWLDRFDEQRDRIGAMLAGKEIRFPVEAVGGIVFLAVGIIMLLIIPDQVAVSKSDVVNGRAFPVLLMVLMIFFSTVLLLREAYRVFIKRLPPATKTLNLLVEVKALAIYGILLMTWIIARLTDLFVIGACFCSVCFLIYFRCRKKSYYAITLGLSVLIWAAFRFGLNVRF